VPKTAIEFKCPECDGHKIEEIMVGMTVATEVGKVEQHDDGKVNYVAGEQTNEDGHVDRYQCKGCGFTIVDDNSPHAANGLDEYALAMAIQALNDPPKKGDLVNFDELVRRIADAHRGLEGRELADIWNGMFPSDPVTYEGDSLFWVDE
jgi:predicted RNA-binding Zn-ribbon protein involved in translation (DUF1610 family)